MATALRHAGRQHRVFLQLLADVVLWSILLASSGAAYSPLGWFYLLRVVIAAVALPRRFTWCIVPLTVGCYTYLYYRYSQLNALQVPRVRPMSRG